jgi:hypothetical protein
VRTGGWGKHNFLSGVAFRKAKYEKLRRRKSEGGAGIPFPPTPFPSRPARAEKFSALPREARQSKFAIRIFVKKGSDFVQKVPPIFKIRILGDCCLALATLGLGFRCDFEGIFEIQKQFLPAQTEVRFAEGKHKFEKFINQSFFFRRRRKAKR